MSTHGPRDEQLFADALARPEHERAAFLDGACNGNAALRVRILALIAAHEGPESLLAAAPGAPRAAVAAEEKPGDWIGRYKLLQKIGEGGCGVVWMAEQEEPVRRRVALKVIKLGMDTKAVVARFEAERQALAMMDHPNIAKVHDAGATETGRPFFVMELVRGIPITKYCDENHLTPTDRLELFIKVCQAIQHAHQKGVIHRDIKPSNILVTVNDGQPTPKVIDFGIAKATQGRLTEATVFTAFEQFIGTPIYMSPEQAEMSSLDIDTRSDIYSLGVLLYELLTGRPPFDPKKFAQAGVDQIRQQIREAEPPRPSARLRTLEDDERTTIARLRNTAASELSIILSGDLDWIVMRCIEKDRTRRYDTANGLAMDIQRYLRNEPVVARPPSVAYLLSKLVSRHRVAFAAAILVLASLIVGLAFATFAFIRERTARAAARQAETVSETGRKRAEEFLSFVFTDFAEQLSDYGHTLLLRQLAAKAIEYYTGLPMESQTRETRAGYAIAVSIGGSTVEAQRAMDISEELGRSGPFTPFLRMAYGFVAYQLVEQYASDSLPLRCIQVCDRAEAVLESALSDPHWGAWTRRSFTKLLHSHAFHLLRLGRPTEAISFFQRALVSADLEDQTPPTPQRPGLRATRIKAHLAEALYAAGRHQEATKVNEQARADLRPYIQSEPFLTWAHFTWGRTAQNNAAFARRQWRFPEFLAATDECQAAYLHLLKLDPKHRSYRVNLASSWIGNRDGRFEYHWLMGDFQSAEAAARNAVEILPGDATRSLGRELLLAARVNLARAYAATGRNAEADTELAHADTVRQRVVDERLLDGTERDLNWVGFQRSCRSIEWERLNWHAIRINAEQVFARLLKLRPSEAEAERLNRAWQIAYHDFIRAAFELGDYGSAKTTLAKWAPPIDPEESATDIQQRFAQLSDRLLRIHVLARGGEVDAARAELTRIWPEVDAVFAAGPDYLFSQVQHARALWIRAEIDGTLAEKRAWLESAASYLRPLAAVGKLTRYEREVLLAAVQRHQTALAEQKTP